MRRARGVGTHSRFISTHWKNNFKIEDRMHESLKNAIDYIEMASRHLAETKRFFSALLGWSFQDYGPDYASFDDGRMTGGFFVSEKNASVDSGAQLIVFYHTELEETYEKIVNLGGEITKEIFQFHVGCRLHFCITSG